MTSTALVATFLDPSHAERFSKRTRDLTGNCPASPANAPLNYVPRAKWSPNGESRLPRKFSPISYIIALFRSPLLPHAVGPMASFDPALTFAPLVGRWLIKYGTTGRATTRRMAITSLATQYQAWKAWLHTSSTLTAPIHSST